MLTRPRLERDYTISEDYDDDDGDSNNPAAPTQSRARLSQRHDYHPDSRSINQPTSYRQVQKPQEDYQITDSFLDLDELEAPSPLERPPDTRQNVFENRTSQEGSARHIKNSRGSDQEQYLSEVAAPPPVGAQYDSSPTSKESISSPSPPVAKRVQKGGLVAPYERASKFATELYTVSYLVLFSILGTLARVGLQALTFYPGAPVQTGLLWANFAGTLIMGFLSQDQRLFREHFASHPIKQKDDEENGNLSTKNSELRPYVIAARKQAASKQHAAVKKTIPLYIGLATGFCGSFTSFSSFIRDAFLALSNRLPVPVSHTFPTPVAATSSTVPRNGGYSFMAICAVIIITVILCLEALQLGAHLAIALEPITPAIPQLFTRRIVDRMIVLIAWTAWLGAVFMTIWPPDRPGGPAGQASWTQEFWRGDALFAIVFAPLGCLLRFYASLHLNGKIQSFPLGTFAVNVFGTAMEGMFYDLQHVPLGGRIGCQVLQGLMDGFCGSLTTVSTWVVELKGLRLRHAYVYGSVSVGVGVGLMVIIMGSLQWSLGFGAPLC